MTLQRVYLVAGELSGDILGAGLMQALRARHPQVEFRGMGGPRMEAQGLKSRFPLETLSVMGLVEVLKHLPELIRVRRTLREEALAWQPDIMIGIDAPDFNIGLEKQLRTAGITTAHYVSPSVWAWRQGRVKKIANAVDAMLTLLPFEADFYHRHHVPVAFVGHPLADELPLENDREAARRALGLDPGAPVLALLPGSRRNEVRFMGATFLEAVTLLCQRHTELQVVIPAATAQRYTELGALLAGYPALAQRITLLEGQARKAMVASDAVLLTSGTAALEAMLCHRAMLVAYKNGTRDPLARQTTGENPVDLAAEFDRSGERGTRADSARGDAGGDCRAVRPATERCRDASRTRSALCLDACHVATHGQRARRAGDYRFGCRRAAGG